MRVNDLVRFIIARECVRVNKEKGKPRPWTSDPILNKYRFCNVRREDDAVTKWLRNTYYPSFVSSTASFLDKGPPQHEDTWFAAVVARLLNNPDALTAVQKYILPWKPEKFRETLHKRKAAGEKNFNAAYIVSTNGVAMDKIDYITYKILGILWAERKNMRPKPTDTLEVYHDMLMQFDGLGSFIAAQVVADLKYIEPLKSAADWWAFAASGPGSRRGLNRVVERDVNAPWREPTWRAQLKYLLEEVNKALLKADWPKLHAQDLQNCLCEFDKYERARLGEGTPKQIYKEKE
jgi:hypothetical protein